MPASVSAGAGNTITWCPVSNCPAIPSDGTKLPKPWNLKQVKFVHAYIANGHNATKAAITAGYGKKTATRIGSRLLTYVHISTAIGKETALAVERIKVDVDEVLTHHKAMAHSDIMDFVVLDQHGRPNLDLRAAKAAGKTKAIKSIEITELPPMTIVSNGEVLQREVIKTKVTLHDKAKTNADLMRHLGIDGAPVVPAGGVTNNIQNNIYVGADPVEICKRVALMLFRGNLPKVNQPGAGSNTGSSAVISTTGTSGSKDSAKPPQS